LKYLIIICAALILALTGCITQSRAVEAPAMDGPLIVQPGEVGLTEVVRTVIPAPAETATPTPAAGPLLEEPTPAASGAPGSFQDCTLTPGLTGCDPSAPALEGQLAFYEPAAQRLVVLDLSSGAGWQTPAQVTWLAWSPDGQYLLVGNITGEYLIYEQGGELLRVLAPDDVPFFPIWQPDGRLALAGEIYSPEGSEARLEYDGVQWRLIVQPHDGEERLLPLESSSPDRLFNLLSWVPGTNLLLGQSYYGGNMARMMGGELITIDSVTGAVTYWEATLPLDTSAAYQWNPTEETGAVPGLAFISPGPVEGVEARRLVLLDLQSANLRYPLPEGVNPTNLAWQPGGEGLAFSADPQPNIAPAEAGKIFTGPGIHLLDASSGTVEPLTQSAAQSVDDWPNWALEAESGAPVLVFARVRTLTNGAQEIEVRARTSDGFERVLVAALPAPDTLGGQIYWGHVLACR
jgi:hypothetical protein